MPLSQFSFCHSRWWECWLLLFFTRKIEQIQQTGSQGFFESSKESEYTDFVDLSGEETKERKTISEWDVEKWDNKFK